MRQFLCSRWGRLTSLVGVILCLWAPPSVARQLTAQSGPNTVALLELFTSEGCNSCPPADTWVSGLTERGFQPDRLVSLAFHVDYWDELGWPDRFAQANFTQRQREIVARHNSRTLYTPQVVVQGRALTKWEALGGDLQRINQSKARADVRLEVNHSSPTALEVTAQATVPDAAEQPHAKLYLALYENRLSSNVKAGENRGRTLKHDHVVREWIGPLDLDAQGMARFQRTLRLRSDWKAQDMGVVAFVQQQQTGDVLQTLLLPLGQ